MIPFILEEGQHLIDMKCIFLTQLGDQLSELN